MGMIVGQLFDKKIIPYGKFFSQEFSILWMHFCGQADI